jgi:hypothetical protein
VKEFMGAICSALITVGVFVVFERTLRKTIDDVPWPLIGTIVYWLLIGLAPGYVAAEIVEKPHSMWIAMVGTAIGAIFIISILRQQIVLPFEVGREFGLLATIGVPALSGGLMARVCTPRGG